MHIILHPFLHIKTFNLLPSVLDRLLTPTTRGQFSGFFGVFFQRGFITTLGTGQFPSNATETAHDGQITLGAFEALRMPRSTWVEPVSLGIFTHPSNVDIQKYHNPSWWTSLFPVRRLPCYMMLGALKLEGSLLRGGTHSRYPTALLALRFPKGISISNG